MKRRREECPACDAIQCGCEPMVVERVWALKAEVSRLRYIIEEAGLQFSELADRLRDAAEETGKGDRQ